MTAAEDKAKDFLLSRFDSSSIKRNGWPDFAVAVLPKPIAFEVKSDSDRMSKAQRDMADLLVRSGWEYYIIKIDGGGNLAVYSWPDRKKVAWWKDTAWWG